MAKKIIARMALIVALGSALVAAVGCGGYHHYYYDHHDRYYGNGYRYR